MYESNILSMHIFIQLHKQNQRTKKMHLKLFLFNYNKYKYEHIKMFFNSILYSLMIIQQYNIKKLKIYV
jgi:hypothetical protein